MFRDGNFEKFDIICIQESFEGVPGCFKELMLLYAQKAGFIYNVRSSSPNHFTGQTVCGGTLILSRFPFAQKAEKSYSYAQGSDGEALLGALYAEILIDFDENNIEDDIEQQFN